MVLIIHYSTPSGSKEGILVTEDLKTEAADFVPPRCSVDSDTCHDIDLPSSFPLDYNLERL